MAETIGTAYVQIEPSFEGVVPKIDKEFGGAGKDGGNSFSQGFAKVAGGVGKVAAGALAAGTAAVIGFTKQAVSSFGEYEQLVGGVETLFKDSAGIVQEYADKAYQTAGLSANKYMETVTSFSASLLQSLGGDTAKAANVADMAIIDMSDNANKMGTSMESIQNAYQGFAKQNYTMLDNLKLGYGGTKTEMERLLADASKLSGIEYDISSFSDVAEAIHVIQTEMGITGTTSAEAAETIQGSVGSIKAAWENLITAIGSGDDLEPYIDNVVNTALTAVGNLAPTIQQSLQGIGELAKGLAPIITQQLPELVSSLLPPLLDAATSLVDGLVQALPSILQTLVALLPGVVENICSILIDNLPMLLDVALQMIVELANGIAQALPTLIPQIVELVISIVDTLLNNIDMLIDAAINLVMALVEGIVTATPRLIEKIPEIIIKIWEAIIRNLPKILQAGVELILTLVKGIVNNYAKVFEVGKQLIDKVKDGFLQKIDDAKTWGKDMIQKFIDGILAKWNDLKASVSNVASSVKDFLGFSEPDKGPLSNFHTYAPDMMQLFAKGIRDNSGLVTDALNGVGSDMMNTGFNVSGVASIGGTVTANIGDSDRLGVIEGMLAQLVSLSDKNIYLDTGALVGGTADLYNRALGSISARSSKR